MILYQKFRVTGVAYSTVFDSGLESTQKVPKTLLSILLTVEDCVGNSVEGWIEKSKIMDLPDEVLDAKDALYAKATEIPINVILAVGEIFKVAVVCGATTKNIYGAYAYEVTG
jgi:hypothetical protein